MNSIQLELIDDENIMVSKYKLITLEHRNFEGEDFPHWLVGRVEEVDHLEVP